MAKNASRGNIIMAGLVAAAIMAFLREPISSPFQDFFTTHLLIGMEPMQLHLVILAIYYGICGLFMTRAGHPPVPIAMAASLWTIGIQLLWIFYTFVAGPFIRGEEGPGMTADLITVNMGIEAMVLFCVVGAFLSGVRYSGK